MEKYAYTHWMSESEQARVSGYRRAAEILLEEARLQGAEVDLLFYPCLYLYRHYFELHLKMITKQEGVAPSNTERSHDLIKHWRKLRRFAEERLSLGRSDVQAIEDAVRLLHEIDPSGTKLRYAYTTKMQKVPDACDDPVHSKSTCELPSSIHVLGEGARSSTWTPRPLILL